MQAPISDIPPGGLAPTTRAVWLPPGRWSRWGGNESVTGPSIDSASYSVAEIPLFVRVGTLLPLAARGGEAFTSPDLIWTIWLDGTSPVNGSSSLYEDDGATDGYQNQNAGARTPAAFSYGEVGARVLRLTVNPTIGVYAGMPPTRAHSLQVRAAPGEPMAVIVNGTAVPRIPPDSAGPGWWIASGVASPLTEPAGAVVVCAGAPLSVAGVLDFVVHF